MKIQKIIDLCKKSGELYITDVDGVQWCGNGQAVYPLIGLPEFTPETICETFGLSEDVQSKMILNTKEAKEYGIDFGDLSGKEDAAEVLRVGISYTGVQLMVLKCDSGIYFIKKKYLTPFEGDVELWKRQTGNTEYFVIATGMLVAGIVVPETGIRPQLAGELKDLVEML